MSETGKIEREDGSTVWIANDGREYKSKSGMWKRNKKLEEEREDTTPPEPKEAKKAESEQGDSPSEPKVEWTEMDSTSSPQEDKAQRHDKRQADEEAT